MRLEKIVQERTAEVVRLEKMATAGKLTQGLIDRILNPLNYINNFAKLSEGLVRDVKANVEDEKDHMDQENYEDTAEVLEMLAVNLQKVGEHGQNTTRTLKAMEEMLKDRSGGISTMDLMAVIRQDKELLHAYYKQEIGKYGIKTAFNDTEDQMLINGNAEQLSKTIMSLLANAVYAVIKKAEKLRTEEGMKEAYSPEISLNVSQHADTIQIRIRDNGIGIEEGILDKIFDPFFTTKTTSEASGVGLYLSREIVQNHGGDIQVKSVKDKYSVFTITLPVRKP
jgi:signal transduction histidine kinase